LAKLLSVLPKSCPNQLPSSVPGSFEDKPRSSLASRQRCRSSTRVRCEPRHHVCGVGLSPMCLMGPAAKLDRMRRAFPCPPCLGYGSDLLRRTRQSKPVCGTEAASAAKGLRRFHRHFFVWGIPVGVPGRGAFRTRPGTSEVTAATFLEHIFARRVVENGDACMKTAFRLAKRIAT
jgi:hypothetical protein